MSGDIIINNDTLDFQTNLGVSNISLTTSTSNELTIVGTNTQGILFNTADSTFGSSLVSIRNTTGSGTIVLYGDDGILVTANGVTGANGVAALRWGDNSSSTIATTEVGVVIIGGSSSSASSPTGFDIVATSTEGNVTIQSTDTSGTAGNTSINAAKALTLQSTGYTGQDGTVDIKTSTTNGNGDIDITASREIKLNPGATFLGSTSGSTTIQAAAVDATTQALVLPASDASGTQILQNDGSGNLSWVTETSGSTSSGANNDIQLSDGAGGFKNATTTDFSYDDTTGIMSVGLENAAFFILGKAATAASNNVGSAVGIFGGTGDGTGNGGNVLLRGGETDTGTSGEVNIQSGLGVTSGSTGSITLQTSNAAVTSGNIEILTGTGNTVGNINLTCGNATTTSGNIVATTTSGEIELNSDTLDINSTNNVTIDSTSGNITTTSTAGNINSIVNNGSISLSGTGGTSGINLINFGSDNIIVNAAASSLNLSGFNGVNIASSTGEVDITSDSLDINTANAITIDSTSGNIVATTTSGEIELNSDILDINTTNNITMDSTAGDIDITASGELKLNSANYSIEPLFTTSLNFEHTGPAGSLMLIRTTNGTLNINGNDTNIGATNVLGLLGDTLNLTGSNGGTINGGSGNLEITASSGEVDINSSNLDINTTNDISITAGNNMNIFNTSTSGDIILRLVSSTPASDTGTLIINNLSQNSSSGGIILATHPLGGGITINGHNKLTMPGIVSVDGSALKNALFINRDNTQSTGVNGFPTLFCEMVGPLDSGIEIITSTSNTVEKPLLSLVQNMDTPNANQNTIEFWCGATPSLRGSIRSTGVTGSLEFKSNASIIHTCGNTAGTDLFSWADTSGDINSSTMTFSPLDVFETLTLKNGSGDIWTNMRINNSPIFRSTVNVGGGSSVVARTIISAGYASNTYAFEINTSLSQYKDNQRPIDDYGNGFTSELIYNLQPRAYESNITNNDNIIEDEAGKTFFGLVAEEVEAVHPAFCCYNDNNDLQSVRYDMLCVPIIAEMKKLRDQVQALQAQVDALTP